MADYAIHDTTLTGIADTIRKKEGSSALIDPADYADRINLMGMLEEKTQASASVCAFDDGADDVSSSSVKVAIPVNLDGVSSVSETQTGRNIADVSTATKASEQRCSYVFENGGLTITATGNYSRVGFAIPCIQGETYTLSYKGSSDAQYKRVLLYPNELWVSASYAQTLTETETAYSTTFTAQSNYIYLGFYLTTTGTTGTETIKDIQIELGSTVHDYERYQTPTVYTASLGRTIYGGEVDIVTGEGVDENDDPFTFTGQEVPTRLGYNAFWSDEGDTEVTYRSSGTITPVVPVLTTKSITENGTYSAEDDDADGYSQVTVDVPQGSTIPFEKVWSSGDTGAETFTCTEAGKYLFMVGTSARGTATITSSVTADFTSSKQGSDGRGLVIAVYTLAVGDTVTMTNTIVDWVYRVKAVFKTSLSVSATIDSAIVTDGTLSSFAPTFTGNALFIYMAGGRADTNSYDRTYTTDNFEWASKMETQTFIRLSYGSNTPTPSIYGYDGGCALAICLQ